MLLVRLNLPLGIAFGELYFELYFKITHRVRKTPYCETMATEY